MRRLYLAPVNAVLVLLLGLTSLHAAPKPIRMSLTSSASEGMVELGDSEEVIVVIENRGKVALTGNLEWEVQTVAFDTPSTQRTEVSIEAGKKIESRFAFKMEQIGFAAAECRFTLDDGKVFKGRRRVGCEPLKLKVPLTGEPDLDRFWKDSIHELGKVTPRFELKSMPELRTAASETFEVTLRSFGDVRVRGWLEVPRSKGPHPAVIRVPGYGGNMKPVKKWDDMIVFSFNPRGHGNSQDDVPRNPVNYWIRGLDDKLSYYYRGAYLDCLRAVDFISQREDVDQDRIAVWGGSQGGGFAMATAALDSRIDLCVTDIPFLCDWVNYFKLTHWPEMNKWIDAKPERTWASTLQTLSYFDAMNLAGRIKCPTLMGVGLQDQTCPPTTNFAAYNRIPARKKFWIYPDFGHGLGRTHYARVWEWIRAEFAVGQE